MTNYSTEYVAALEEIDFKFWKQVSDDYYKEKFNDPEPEGLKRVQNKGFLLDINPKSPKELVALIEERIENFDFENPDYEKLATIFDLIQAWGGRQARWFYAEQRKKGQPSDVKTSYRKSFPKWQGVYLAGAKLAKSQKPEEVLKASEALEVLEEFEKIKGLGTSFGSKHLKFWSNKYPVVDARINLIFGGRNNPNRKSYEKVLPLLENLGKLWGCRPIKAENIVYTFSANYFLTGKLEFDGKPEFENDYEIAQKIVTLATPS